MGSYNIPSKKLAVISLPKNWQLYPFQKIGSYIHSKKLAVISLPKNRQLYPFQKIGSYIPSKK